jgi:hypothetical protein
MLGINRNDEPWTGEAAAKPWTQATWDGARGDASQRVGAEVAECLCIPSKSDERRSAAGRITWRASAGNPRNHQALKACNGGVLQALRLRSSHIEICRIGTGVIQDGLRSPDIAAGCAVMLSGDAAAEEHWREVRQQRTRFIRMRTVPNRNAYIGAGDEPLDADPQSLVADRTDAGGAVAANKKKVIAFAWPCFCDERFCHRCNSVDQVRRSVWAPPVEGPALCAPYFTASSRLGPVDHDPVVVERMRRQAIAPDKAKRLGIGGCLDSDRQEKRYDRVDMRASWLSWDSVFTWGFLEVFLPIIDLGIAGAENGL